MERLVQSRKRQGGVLGRLWKLLQLGSRATDIKLLTGVRYPRQFSLAMRQLSLESIGDGFGPM